MTMESMCAGGLIAASKIALVFLLALVPLAPCGAVTRLFRYPGACVGLPAIVLLIALASYADLLLGWILLALLVSAAIRHRHKDCAPEGK